MDQLPTRSARRRYVAWLTILSGALASCTGITGESDTFDLNASRSPINGVVVYAGSFHYFAEVDDSIGVMAWGYHNGEGWGAQSVTTANWAASDPTVLRIVRSSFRVNSAAAVLRGVRPGLVALSATLNGVTGSDTIRVLPKIRALELKSTRATLSLGDTVEIWLRAEDMTGDSIPDVRPLYVPELLQMHRLQYIGPWPRQRYVGKDTGVITFQTVVANDSAALSLRVLP